jgi:hypothetical protein
MGIETCTRCNSQAPPIVLVPCREDTPYRAYYPLCFPCLEAEMVQVHAELDQAAILIALLEKS